MRSRVVFDISLSVDGFMRGPNPRPGNVLGDGGDALHAWVGEGATQADRQLLEQSIHGAGAVICGRRTYDDSLPSWRVDGPTGPVRLPVFVVSHSTAPAVPGGVYHFAGDPAATLQAARQIARGKDICIMGGADVGRQFLRAGVVDEVSLHVAPVLLGGGTPMFDDALGTALPLDIISITPTSTATHLRYAIVCGGRQLARGAIGPEATIETQSSDTADEGLTITEVLDQGPFFHGTVANLRVGDLLTAGYRSNYRPDVVMNHVYFTASVDGAGLAAELAAELGGGGAVPRVYAVEPIGTFENDPNVTDKKFPGNPTRSYRSSAPLKIVGEVYEWTRLTPVALQSWRDRLTALPPNERGEIIN